MHLFLRFPSCLSSSVSVLSVGTGREERWAALVENGMRGIKHKTDGETWKREKMNGLPKPLHGRANPSLIPTGINTTFSSLLHRFNIPSLTRQEVLRG